MADTNRFSNQSLEELARRYQEEMMRMSRRAAPQAKEPSPRPEATPPAPAPSPEPVAMEGPVPHSESETAMQQPQPQEPLRPTAPSRRFSSNAEYFWNAFLEDAPKARKDSFFPGQMMQREKACFQESLSSPASRWPDAGQRNPDDDSDSRNGKGMVQSPQEETPQALEDDSVNGETEMQPPVDPVAPIFPPFSEQPQENGVVDVEPRPEEFPRGDNPPANQGSDENSNNSSAEPFTDTGYLRIETYTAGRAVPVPFAQVLVSRNIDGEILLSRKLETGANGRSPTIALPAPPRELSETPDSPYPFALYQIAVSAPNYQSERLTDIQVFAGQISIIPVELIPLSGTASIREATQQRNADQANQDGLESTGENSSPA